MMLSRTRALLLGAMTMAAPMLLGCQKLDRFDTQGEAAYCGSIVSAQFIRTSETDGGFERNLRLHLELDADALTTAPGTLTSDDSETGPCTPMRTFETSPLVPTTEIYHDGLSMMNFDEGQEYNFFAWVGSTCRGPMLSIVSLLKNDEVEVRLLKPPETQGAKPAFALFQLQRRSGGCGF